MRVIRCGTGDFACSQQGFSEPLIRMEINNDALHPRRCRRDMRVHEQNISLPRMSVTYLVGDHRVRIMGQGLGIVRMIEDGRMVVACGKLSDEESSRRLGN